MFFLSLLVAGSFCGGGGDKGGDSSSNARNTQVLITNELLCEKQIKCFTTETTGSEIVGSTAAEVEAAFGTPSPVESTSQRIVYFYEWAHGDVHEDTSFGFDLTGSPQRGLRTIFRLNDGARLGPPPACTGCR